MHESDRDTDDARAARMTLDPAHIERRAAVATLALGVSMALLWPRFPRAQPAAGPRRIGLLALFPDTPQYARWVAALREGLHRLGYVGGSQFVIESRYAAGQGERLPGLAAELLASKVDVLVTAPAGPAAFAAKATRSVPIVFIGEPDPVATGLIASLAHPGGNVTGLADEHADLVPKRLELLRQISPAGAAIAVLWNPSNPSTAQQVRIAETAAASLRIRVVPVAVKGNRDEDVDQAFDTIVKRQCGSAFVVGDATLGTHRRRIAELAIKHRLPTSGSHGGWAEGGLLMSYGTDFTVLFARAAELVDKILKGAKPSDLPVQQPTAFELVFNAATAKAIGLSIPPSLLSRADRMIE